MQKFKYQQGASWILVMLVLLAVALGVLYYVSNNYTLVPLKNNFLSKATPSPEPTVFTPAQTEVTVISPGSGATIVSPVNVVGTIDKSWTFESSFRIEILDDARQEITDANVPVTFATEESMIGTFTASIPFETEAKSGFIVIHNDNPSGLPENDKTFEVPVNFN